MKAILLFFSTAVFCSIANVVLGKNILLVPCQITSHFIQQNEMTSGLVQNGHKVYTVISSSFTEKDKALKDWITPLYFHQPQGTTFVGDLTPLFFSLDKFTLGTMSSEVTLQECEAMVRDKKLNEDIKRIGFDLAIVDGFVMSYCTFLLPHIHGIPFVFTFRSSV